MHSLFLLDVGAKTQIAIEDLPKRMNAVWNKPLHGDANGRFEAAERAPSILYLADNAGEMFFDRVLIDALPAGKVTVCMRGAPIINDATMEDAIAAGLPAVAEVMDNGSDAPVTLLKDCSEAFRQRFEQVNMIIVKCPVIASYVGAPVCTLVIRR